MKANFSKGKFIDIENNSEIYQWEEYVISSFVYETPRGLKRLFWSTGFYIFSWILILPGVLLSVLRKNKIKKIFSDFHEKRFSLLKKWFSDHYEDIDLVGRPDQQKILTLINRHRGIGVPSDAKISKWTNGYVFANNKGMKMNLATAWWHWTRYDGENDVDYYSHKIYTWITLPDQKWKDFEFNIHRDTIFTKTKRSLENDEFNKKWIYKNNNPIKLRMLLTPATQEEIVKKLNHHNGHYHHTKSFSFLKDREDFLASLTINSNDNPFFTDVPTSVDLLDKHKIALAAYQDIISDVKFLQTWFEIISIFRVLFK